MALKIAFAVCLGIAVICRIVVRILSARNRTE
jgi:hypothetical protein